MVRSSSKKPHLIWYLNCSEACTWLPYRLSSSLSSTLKFQALKIACTHDFVRHTSHHTCTRSLHPYVGRPVESSSVDDNGQDRNQCHDHVYFFRCCYALILFRSVSSVSHHRKLDPNRITLPKFERCYTRPEVATWRETCSIAILALRRIWLRASNRCCPRLLG